MCVRKHICLLKTDKPAIQILVFQKQPSRDVLLGRCSENIQQIYRKTPITKCDFNKVDFNKISPVNLLHISRTSFPRNTSGRLLLVFACLKWKTLASVTLLLPGHQHFVYFQCHCTTKVKSSLVWSSRSCRDVFYNISLACAASPILIQ